MTQASSSKPISMLVTATTVVAALSLALAQPPAGKKNAITEITIQLGNGVKIEFVRIPKGTFKMCWPPDEKGRKDDEFQHEVEISKDYYLGKYEVTQEQYETLIGKNPSYYSASGGGKDKVQGLDTRRFP